MLPKSWDSAVHRSSTSQQNFQYKGITITVTVVPHAMTMIPSFQQSPNRYRSAPYTIKLAVLAKRATKEALAPMATPNIIGSAAPAKFGSSEANRHHDQRRRCIRYKLVIIVDTRKIPASTTRGPALPPQRPGARLAPTSQLASVRLRGNRQPVPSSSKDIGPRAPTPAIAGCSEGEQRGNQTNHRIGDAMHQIAVCPTFDSDSLRSSTQKMLLDHEGGTLVLSTSFGMYGSHSGYVLIPVIRRPGHRFFTSLIAILLQDQLAPSL
jgi:hypothetical protein